MMTATPHLYWHQRIVLVSLLGLGWAIPLQESISAQEIILLGPPRSIRNVGVDSPGAITIRNSGTLGNIRLIDPRENSFGSILTWENWSSPYWSGGSICRERAANTVCLSPEVAERLRWYLPQRTLSNQ